MAIKIGRTQRQVIEYLQDHPWDGMNTTGLGLAQKIAEGLDGVDKNIYMAMMG